MRVVRLGLFHNSSFILTFSGQSQDTKGWGVGLDGRRPAFLGACTQPGWAGGCFLPGSASSLPDAQPVGSPTCAG
ncbi:MAG: hypothetical protein V9G20_01325 [Candidatus Promineifilaceae bacterium]